MKKSKKILALLLAVVMIAVIIFAFNKCGDSGKREYHHIGDTVSTDIAEVTLDNVQLASALYSSFKPNNADERGTPREYDPSKGADGCEVAAKGHTFLNTTFTVKNNDRVYMNLAGLNNTFVSVEHGENEYSDIKFMAQFKEDDVHWHVYESENFLVNSEKTVSMRGYFDVAEEITSDNFGDAIVFTFFLPNSSGEREKFYFEITEESLNAGAENEQKRLEDASKAASAAFAERTVKADAATTAKVKKYVQGQCFNYTTREDKLLFKHEIEFSGDRVVVTSTAYVSGTSTTVEKKGKYTVCKNDIFIDFDSDTFIDVFIPFTIESDGSVQLYEMENVQK